MTATATPPGPSSPSPGGADAAADLLELLAEVRGVPARFKELWSRLGPDGFRRLLAEWFKGGESAQVVADRLAAELLVSANAVETQTRVAVVTAVVTADATGR